MILLQCKGEKTKPVSPIHFPLPAPLMNTLAIPGPPHIIHPPPPPLSSVISEGSMRSAPLLGMTYRPEVLCAHVPVSRGERSIGRQCSRCLAQI